MLSKIPSRSDCFVATLRYDDSLISSWSRRGRPIIWLLMAWAASSTMGQGPAGDKAAARPQVFQRVQQINAEPTLQLSARGEIPLPDVLADFAAQLNFRIVFDKQLSTRKINLVAPDPIPLSALNELFQTILLSEGLVITDPDNRGIRRIVPNTAIASVTRPSGEDEPLDRVEAAVPITRVFVLGDSSPANLAEIVRPFLTTPGGSVVPLDRGGLMLITDVASNVRRIEQLLALLDGRDVQIDVQFVPVQNVAAEPVAEQLQTIFDARQRALGRQRGELVNAGGNGNQRAELGGVEITVQPRTNSLILIGTPEEIEKVKTVLRELDRPLQTIQQTFGVRFISPERLDQVVRAAIGDRSPPPPYQSRIENNVLIVDTVAPVIELIEQTRRRLDTRIATGAESPVRFYKIKNVPAEELVETIRGVGGRVAVTRRRENVAVRDRITNDVANLNGPRGNVPVQTGGGFGVPNQFGFPNQAGGLNNGFGNQPLVEIDAGLNNAGGLQGGLQGFQRGLPGDLVRDDQPVPEGDNVLTEAEVAVDVHTNTIIVVAPPEVQQIYATLIEQLDQRRPQVLIEARVVIVDTSDDYSLGVEVSGGDRQGLGRLFAFSSYGLSTADPTTGALQILPGVGFNGTLVDPNTADVVVRALANHRRARVLSTPRILVNDNAEGQLTSVLEVPFTSVNASQTVATTSFAGFAEAGTTITVTPTISDDNYLQLDYVVTLNSFTGAGAAGVPPPRQTNEIQSRVTVPDGYTVIVGGLTSKNESYNINSLPIVEQIPVLRDLLSLQTDSFAETSLFVFLKPVILREDKFKDLRFVSDRELAKACEPGNFPETPPLLLK